MQSVMSATDMLGHLDVRGLSTTDPQSKLRINGNTIHIYDTGPPRRPGLVHQPRFLMGTKQAYITSLKVESSVWSISAVKFNVLVSAYLRRTDHHQRG